MLIWCVILEHIRVQPPKIDRYSYNRTTYNRLFWVFMFIRAYLRASTKDQDANRAKDGVSTEFGENSTLSILY